MTKVTTQRKYHKVIVRKAKLHNVPAELIEETPKLLLDHKDLLKEHDCRVAEYKRLLNAGASNDIIYKALKLCKKYYILLYLAVHYHYYGEKKLVVYSVYKKEIRRLYSLQDKLPGLDSVDTPLRTLNEFDMSVISS